MSSDLAEHLKFFGELGVSGVSRDPAWRRRVGDAGAEAPALQEGDSAGSAEAPVRSAAQVRSAGASAPASATDADGPTPVEEPGELPGVILMTDEIPLPEATAESAADKLGVIKAEIGPDCSRCKLHTLGRRQVVYGVGNPRARLMFVGEAPGEEEDKQGEPFVGRAGQLLTKIIEAISLTRDQVYIANVIKCRPPGNRNPEPDEVSTCEPFLFRQIDVIQPRVIVTLGKFAAQSLLRTADPITRLRGREFDYRGATLIPTFHPAYLLRNPSAKREVWEDMKKVRSILQGDST
jgi:uracil-DNA glycosylase family 4